MKLSISASPARAAALAAIAARTFVTLTIDAPPTHNGAYLCPMIAAALVLPWLLCLRELRRFKTGAPISPLMAMLLPVILLDAAVTAVEISGSAGYLALDRVSTQALLIPVGLAALWSVSKNGDAMGYAAALWARLFPVLLVLIIVLQARRYRPEWLQPLLGSGGRAIVGGGIRLAGRLIPCSAVLLLPEGNEDEHIGTTAVMLVIAVLIASGLILSHRMMTPTPLRERGWLNRLDGLLTNGRAPLYLQLPMICTWYAGLFHLLSCECFTGAALLQYLLPSVDGLLCAVAAVAAVILAAGFLPVFDVIEAASGAMYVVLAPVTALVAIHAARKGGISACA